MRKQNCNKLFVKSITIALTPAQIEWVDERRGKQSRGEFFRDILDTLADLEELENNAEAEKAFDAILLNELGQEGKKVVEDIVELK